MRIGNGKTKKRLNIKEEKFVTTLQDKFDLSKLAKNPCPTNKIYRRSVLVDNNITWPEEIVCEDKLFTTQAVYFANGLVTVPGIKYYYFRNPNSTVNSKKARAAHHKDDKNNARKEVLAFLREKKADIKDKDFTAVEKELKFFGITFFTVKETLYAEKCYLFSCIKIWERACK